MSTRYCIVDLKGTDESEGGWDFDIHADFHDGSRLDVMAITEESRRPAEFSLDVPQARELHDALGKWLHTDPETGRPR